MLISTGKILTGLLRIISKENIWSVNTSSEDGAGKAIVGEKKNVQAQERRQEVIFGVRRIEVFEEILVYEFLEHIYGCASDQTLTHPQQQALTAALCREP